MPFFFGKGTMLRLSLIHLLQKKTVQFLGSIPEDLKSATLLPCLQLVLHSLVQFDRHWFNGLSEKPLNGRTIQKLLHFNHLQQVYSGLYFSPSAFTLFNWCFVIRITNWLQSICCWIGYRQLLTLVLFYVFLLPFMRRRAMDIDESIFHYILVYIH